MGKKEDFTFDGFEPANTTPIPDVLFDVLLTKLTGAELKVLLYIMRRTWGFKKDTDAISLSQFQDGITTRDGKVLDKGCGIKRRETICQALETLEKMGCITSQKERHNDGDNATTIYSIHFKDVVSKPDYPSFKTGLPVVSQSDYGSPVSGLPLVSKPDSQLNSNTRNSTQETVRQESIVTSAIAGSDAPAPIDFTEQKKKRDTDPRIAAVKGQDNAVNHTDLSDRDNPLLTGNNSPAHRHASASVASSHSQADIGNEETVKMPAIPKQTPAAGAAIPPSSGIGEQASRTDGTNSTPAQRSGSSPAGIPASPGAVQAGKRKGKVTQAKPAIALTAQEQAFWDLWRGVWFNLDIPPDLTETAYGHVKKLAPFITTSEQLNSLIDYTRKDLAASQNIKRKMVQLGNMVFCYAGWKQAQQPRKDNTEPAPDFDNYKGNGAEERAARRQLYEEMKARGELIS